MYTPCKTVKVHISPFCVVSDRLNKVEKGEETERYRVLVQNGFHGVSGADALAKINVNPARSPARNQSESCEIVIVMR